MAKRGAPTETVEIILERLDEEEPVSAKRVCPEAPHVVKRENPESPEPLEQEFKHEKDFKAESADASSPWIEKDLRDYVKVHKIFQVSVGSVITQLQQVRQNLQAKRITSLAKAIGITGSYAMVAEIQGQLDLLSLRIRSSLGGHVCKLPDDVVPNGSLIDLIDNYVELYNIVCDRFLELESIIKSFHPSICSAIHLGSLLTMDRVLNSEMIAIGRVISKLLRPRYDAPCYFS